MFGCESQLISPATAAAQRKKEEKKRKKEEKKSKKDKKSKKKKEKKNKKKDGDDSDSAPGFQIANLVKTNPQPRSPRCREIAQAPARTQR